LNTPIYCLPKRNQKAFPRHGCTGVSREGWLPGPWFQSRLPRSWGKSVNPELIKLLQKVAGSEPGGTSCQAVGQRGVSNTSARHLRRHATLCLKIKSKPVLSPAVDPQAWIEAARGSGPCSPQVSSYCIREGASVGELF